MAKKGDILVIYKYFGIYNTVEKPQLDLNKNKLSKKMLKATTSQLLKKIVL